MPPLYTNHRGDSMPSLNPNDLATIRNSIDLTCFDEIPETDAIRALEFLCKQTVLHEDKTEYAELPEEFTKKPFDKISDAFKKMHLLMQNRQLHKPITPEDDPEEGIFYNEVDYGIYNFKGLQGYDLVIGPQPKFLPKTIEFMVDKESEIYIYRVVSIDGKSVETGVINWNEISLPKEEKEIFSDKANLLPVILRYTTEAGHTAIPTDSELNELVRSYLIHLFQIKMWTLKTLNFIVIPHLHHCKKLEEHRHSYFGWIKEDSEGMPQTMKDMLKSKLFLLQLKNRIQDERPDMQNVDQFVDDMIEYISTLPPSIVDRFAWLNNIFRSRPLDQCIDLCKALVKKQIIFLNAENVNQLLSGLDRKTNQAICDHLRIQSRLLEMTQTNEHFTKILPVLTWTSASDYLETLAKEKGKLLSLVQTMEDFNHLMLSFQKQYKFLDRIGFMNVSHIKTATEYYLKQYLDFSTIIKSADDFIKILPMFSKSKRQDLCNKLKGKFKTKDDRNKLSPHLTSVELYTVMASKHRHNFVQSARLENETPVTESTRSKRQRVSKI